MDWKKGIITAIIYYVILFVIGIAAMSVMQTGTIEFGVVMWITTTVLLFILGNYYYFKKKPSNPIKEGLTLGVLVAVISLMIEVPVLVYVLNLGWGFYSVWTVWVGYLLVIIMPAIVAKLKK